MRISASKCTAVAIWLALMVAGLHCGGDSAKRPGETQGSLARPLRVGIVSWPGYAGGLLANGGFKPNKTCIFWRRHSLLVEFRLMEDVDARAKAFARGGDEGVDVIWSTVDFWANELPGFEKGGVRARAIMQVDWSRGGDAIVADASIHSLAALKGKRIALALFTPSHWLLEYSLEQSGLPAADQAQIVKSLIGKNASPDARMDFVTGKADAAVVWEPDVTEALRRRPGSHILASTRTFSNLIADIMVVREDFIAQHADVVGAFVAGWLEGADAANRAPERVVSLLMDNEPLYRELGAAATRAGLGTVRWANLADNTAMFGLDGGQPLFDKVFAQAGDAWVRRRYIDKQVAPSEAKDDRFLRQIYLASSPRASAQQRPSKP